LPTGISLLSAKPIRTKKTLVIWGKGLFGGLFLFYDFTARLISIAQKPLRFGQRFCEDI
jgi:hypothetical protein